MGSLEERNRLGQALNDIDLRIHSKLGSDQILQSTLDSFVSALGADAGDIKLLDGEEWVVSYEHGFGPAEVGLRLSAPEAPVATRVAELREPVTVTDYLAEPTDFYVGFPLRHGLRATLALPLFAREEVVGCLFAWMRHEPRAFTEGEIDFARRIAASAALALENARLFEAEQRARRQAEAIERRLSTVIRTMPVGVFIVDADGAVTEMNDAARAIWADTSPTSSRRDYGEYVAWWPQTGELVLAEEWTIARALRERLPQGPEIIDIQRFDGRRGAVLSAAVPLFDEEGNLAGGVAVLEDITDSERYRRDLADARDRLEVELTRSSLLLQASDDLASATDSDALLERLAHIVLEATGVGRVFVNLVDMDRRVLTPKIPAGGVKAPGGREIELERLSDTAQRAIAGKEAALLDYELPDTPEKDKAIARANESRLVLFVPLIHHDEVIGHISLDEPNKRYEFTAQQIRIVESIAAQAAVALVNVQLFEREHRIAETLQRAILSPPERLDALDVAWLYRPASSASNVGGDFYDVFALDGERVALLIGDVSGKGIEAAQLTTLIRDGARAYLFEKADPSAVFDRLNALVYRFTPTEKFATAFLGVLDCSTGSIVHCGAGHPSPIVVGPSGGRALDCQPGMLGAFEDMRFDSSKAVIDTNETIVFFTDGLTEARRDTQMYGERGVLAALERLNGTPIADLPDALLAEVLDFTNGRLHDDVVILCATRKVDAAQPHDSTV